MKRACLVLIAVLAVLLVYPATMPSAKSPGIDDSPTIHVTPPGHVPGDGFGQGGDDDEGDADDLSGIKGVRETLGGQDGASAFYSGGSAAKVWWMYFLYHVRVMF